MKKTIIIFLLLALLASACNYIVVKRDPSVLNSSIKLSGEITGDIYPEVRTISMRASGQAGNFLLLEIYGMESFCDTRSLEVNDSLAGNQLYLSLIDDGTPGTERCYRNVQFWVGPFEREQTYTLHLSEMNDAFFRDSLSLTFNYDQHLDTTVMSNSCGYLIGDLPLNTIVGYCPHYDSSNLPDSLSKYREYEPDSIYFEEQDSSLLVVSIITGTCSTIFNSYAEAIGDTLVMHAWSGPIPTNMCETNYYFFYEFNDYLGQVFYYHFDFNIFTMFEGFYGLP